MASNLPNGRTGPVARLTAASACFRSVDPGPKADARNRRKHGTWHSFVRTFLIIVTTTAAVGSARPGFLAPLLLENRLDRNGGAEDQNLGGAVVGELRVDLHAERITAGEERLGEAAPGARYRAHFGGLVGRDEFVLRLEHFAFDLGKVLTVFVIDVEAAAQAQELRFVAADDLPLRVKHVVFLEEEARASHGKEQGIVRHVPDFDSRSAK